VSAWRGARLLWAASVAALSLVSAALGGDSPHKANDAPPKSLDPRLSIELFAEAPQIVTPTGLAVDYRGRVWAIESNTHFPPADYKGHPSDRILVFAPNLNGGRAGAPQVFADGFRHAMSIAVPYGDGVYVATRREVFHLVDKDGDGKPDERRSILKLETKGDYPHNGLAGIAFDGLGYMYIGLGENLGADYRLVGTDGRAISGGGEGGSLFRFRPDGTDLTLWATGFWNPHASCVDAFGNMFTVDNDPDDRPPCRLLHIIPGGDYGYRFRNGRRGIHPFTAWDGELPGTLPMVCGTGEAPSGIIAYESDTFPEEYRGSLLASSWGDHRIDRFRPKPQGTSFTAKLEPIIVGGENFRPVGVALAPDGTVYFTDWVSKEYHLHGKGRIWRIVAKQPSDKPVEDLAALDKLSFDALRRKLDSPRLDVRRRAAALISQHDPAYSDPATSLRGQFEVRWALASAWNSNTGTAPKRVSPIRSSLKNVDLPPMWPDFEKGAELQKDDVLLARLKQPWPVNPSHVLLALVSRRSVLEHIKRAWLGKVSSDGDRFAFAAVVQLLTDAYSPSDLAKELRPDQTPCSQLRLALLVAARHNEGAGWADAVLPVAFRDADPRVRFTAIQWVGESKLAQFRPEIERQLSDSNTTAELFEAALASLEMLDGVKRSPKLEFSGADYALRLACDQNAADAVRAMALRIVPLEHKGLLFSKLTALMREGGPQLRLEAVRTFRDLPFAGGPKVERELALDEHADRNMRLEAIAGLAAALSRDEHDAETSTALRRLADGKDRELAFGARRALRTSTRKVDAPDVDSNRPRSLEEWVRLAASGGDPEAGRRLFNFPNSVACYRCHTVHGRGGKIGPDLSSIARSSDRTKLAESILRPAKEIAPQFATWSFVTRGGRTLSGVLVSEDREGHLRIGGADGRVTEIEASEIEERVPQTTSIMPERLTDLLTVGEFRDLVAYLATLK
jgi:putative membrane-bound dehydrogenase-like protein